MYGNQMAKNMVGNMAKNMAGNGFLVRRRDVDDKGQPLKKPQKPRQERQNPRFELSSKVRKRCKKQGKIDVEAYVNERLFHDAQGGHSHAQNASPECHGNVGVDTLPRTWMGISLQDAPKTRPDAPKTLPRRPQDAPRCASDAPRRVQDAPRWPKKAKTTMFLVSVMIQHSRNMPGNPL